MTHRFLPSKLTANSFKLKAISAGFSLVELIVVVSIILVISAIVLINHERFQGNVLVSSLAYDVALSIRQAQVFGLGVRGAESGAIPFETGYGIHIDSSDNASYILFADRDRNHKCDGCDTAPEFVRKFDLNRGYRIAKLCVNTTCWPDDVADIKLHIVFDRPEPDAIVSKDSDSPDFNSEATITIRSPQGAERTVRVTQTGQIAVEK